MASERAELGSRDFVDELMTNAAWTVITGLLLVVPSATAAATQKPDTALEPLWVGILMGLVVHLIMNVLMVLSRIWTTRILRISAQALSWKL